VAQRIWIAAIASLVLLAACAGFDERPPGPPFQGIKPPEHGSARVYIFRPGFTGVSARDSPTLSIDTKTVGELLNNAYMELVFRPGDYRLTLRAGTLESGIWDGDFRMRVESGKTYFLAIWNDVTATPGIQLLPVGKFLIAIPAVHDNLRNSALRWQIVDEKEAVPVLSRLTYLQLPSASFVPASPAEK
jgi:hypothetical protein